MRGTLDCFRGMNLPTGEMRRIEAWTRRCRAVRAAFVTFVAVVLATLVQEPKGALAQGIDLELPNPLFGVSSGRLPEPLWGSPAGRLYMRAWAWELQEIDAIGKNAKCHRAAWERGRMRLHVLKAKARAALERDQEDIRTHKPDGAYESLLARFLRATRFVHWQDVDFTIFDTADLELWAHEAMSRRDYMAIERYQYPPFDCPQVHVLENGGSGQHGLGVSARLSFGSVLANLATDGLTYCTYGTAEPAHAAFVPADETGQPLPPESVAMTPPDPGATPATSPRDPPIPPLNSPTIEISDSPDAMAERERRRRQIDRLVRRLDEYEAFRKALREGRTERTRITGPDGSTLQATPGPDDLEGSSNGRETFYFAWEPGFEAGIARNSRVTLDEGDRIRNYQSGEIIVIDGINLKREGFVLKYDADTDQTLLEIYQPDSAGKVNVNGLPDKTIILEGDKRGEIIIHPFPRGGHQGTEFEIRFPPREAMTAPDAPTQEGAGTTPGGEAGSPRPGGADAPPPASPETAPPAAGDKPIQRAEPAPGNDKATGSGDESGAQRPAAASPGSDQPSNAANTNPVGIFIKATQSALTDQSQGSELKQQVVKLMPIAEPALPKAESTSAAKAEKAALDTGYDKSPVQCTTDDKGECRAELPAEEREIYGFPSAPAPAYRAEIARPQNSGGVIMQPAGGPKIDLSPDDIPPGARVISTEFKIGNLGVTRLTFEAPPGLIPALSEHYAKRFGKAYQTDFCEEKKPGPPLGTAAASLKASSNDLPRAAISLRRPASLRAPATKGARP